MNKQTKIALVIIVLLIPLLIYWLSHKTSLPIISDESSNNVLKLSNGISKINDSSYEYILGSDQRIHLHLNQNSISGAERIYFDNMEISKSLVELNGTVQYISDYHIKPGLHKVSIRKKTNDTNLSIYVKYVYDSAIGLQDINTSWNSKSHRFVTVMKDGILLKNTDRRYGSFAFKRVFDNDVTCLFEFIPLKYKPGMSIYFGESIYFMFNNTNVLAMKKNTAKGKDIRMIHAPITRLKEGTLHTIQIKRVSNTYKIYLDGKETLVYDDNATIENRQHQGFRNIGISIPKNGSIILLKKIVVE